MLVIKRINIILFTVLIGFKRKISILCRQRLFKKPSGSKMVKNANGKNPESLFYIIWRTPPGAGFFSNFFFVIGHLLIAERMGAIPVVDMQNYKTLYNEEDNHLYSGNSWEYYFQQPGGVSLEEALNSKNVLWCSGEYNHEITTQISAIQDEKLLRKIHHLIQKYIKILPAVDQAFNKYVINLLNRRVLGVHARGTDMRKGIVEGHVKSISSDDLIILVKEEFYRGNYDYIFVATEDEEYLSSFIDIFGDKLLYTDCYRVSSDKQVVNDDKFDWLFADKRQNHKFLLGQEALLDGLFLMSCTSLICGISSVSNFAIYANNNNFEKVIVVTDLTQ